MLTADFTPKNDQEIFSYNVVFWPLERVQREQCFF